MGLGSSLGEMNLLLKGAGSLLEWDLSRLGGKYFKLYTDMQAGCYSLLNLVLVILQHFGCEGALLEEIR